MINNLLTPEALAQRWDLMTSTLDQWRWTGRGPVFIKLGAKVLYRIEDVEYFEKKRRHRHTAMPLGLEDVE